jgi:hypothetical protein
MSAKLVPLALSLFACASLSANAQNAALPASKGMVEFDLMVVQLSEANALPLVQVLRDPKRSATATNMVFDLVEHNHADLIAWPFLATVNGQRAVCEQIEEFRYATEYDSPGRASVTDTRPATTGTSKSPTVPVDAITPPPSVDSTGRVTTTVSEFDGIPTSFETRNLGVTLEIEPTIAPDGKAIGLSLCPQHVSLLRMQKAEIEDKKSGRKVVVEQPEFVTNKVTTSITVQDGDTTLLGVFKVPEPKGTMELFILHTKIKR